MPKKMKSERMYFVNGKKYKGIYGSDWLSVFKFDGFEYLLNLSD